jgi:hypothetical protein
MDRDQTARKNRMDRERIAAQRAAVDRQRAAAERANPRPPIGVSVERWLRWLEYVDTLPVLETDGLPVLETDGLPEA